MTKFKIFSIACSCLLSIFFVSCENEPSDSQTAQPDVSDYQASKEVSEILEASGFDIYNKPPIEYKEGQYIVEGDISMTYKDIMEFADPKGHGFGSKQYSTDNLVRTNGDRTINVFITENGFNEATITAAEIAIDRYNDLNLELKFRRVFSANQADMQIVRQFFLLDFFGVLGSAGFPTASGDPFGQISLSGRLSNNFDVNGIASIIAHEMGHSIGFRHTDFFDRSVSCGGASSPEGDGGVGANQIPGTPSGATVEDGSWMLACFNGSDRQFNADDITALRFLY